MYYTTKNKDMIIKVITRNHVDDGGPYLSQDLPHYLQ